ncbi:methyltransferase domain-containing protein [Chitinophaga agrisoli]|uniref:Methyltransferase domain-containing protein n=1 Tax=Chitinophaga agrisoli TaxID=2607653 RepID=A0A5B2VLK1_9BACT|nr:class I SAM-dependent methyltransferase [Chitinophaga agrisoli]KAA2239147.1 methyltransferase domain-containing protein [Chitinophaga agrisoli]
MTIKSPVTHGERVALITQFPTERIVEEYRQQGISVERFFRDTPTIDLYECGETGYRFYYPDTVFGDGQFYADLQGDDEHYYPTGKPEHLFAAKQLKSTDRVLEVGAGDGFFLKILKEKGIAARGLELNPKAIETGRAQGLQLDGEMIQDHAQQHVGEYDAVCTFQVLEHIYDVRDYLQSCLLALKKGGKLIIGVPNSNPFMYKHDRWHLRNLPPHHAGLWTPAVFKTLPEHFDMTLDKLFVERLHNEWGQYREWYEVQRDYHLQRNPLWGKVLAAIPRPLYKIMLKVGSPFIAGTNIVAVFVKS